MSSPSHSQSPPLRPGAGAERTGEILVVDRLSHVYGDRRALDSITLSIRSAELFCVLGPNGSGKTTLFRILSTLIPVQSGRGCVSVFGLDIVNDRDTIRRHTGTVFQSPSVDRQLTCEENLRHHGHLYGLRGRALRLRIDEMLASLGLRDRRTDRVGTLSGGMRRRVELAKGLLTRPRLLVLDEPSTGLDPAARIDLWQILHRVRAENGVTVLLTTHLMDEADRCDRLAVLDDGKLLACDTPAALKSTIGGDVITLTMDHHHLHSARDVLRDRLGLACQVLDDTVRLEEPDAHHLIPRIIESLPVGSVRSIGIGKPTLEDVFVHLTGHRLHDESRAVNIDDRRA